MKQQQKGRGVSLIASFALIVGVVACALFLLPSNSFEAALLTIVLMIGFLIIGLIVFVAWLTIKGILLLTRMVKAS